MLPTIATRHMAGLKPLRCCQASKKIPRGFGVVNAEPHVCSGLGRRRFVWLPGEGWEPAHGRDLRQEGD
jgi:hypothetical protein